MDRVRTFHAGLGLGSGGERAYRYLDAQVAGLSNINIII